MNTATYNGREVEILSKNGGWSQIALPNGSTRKIRNGDLKPVKAKAPAAAKAATKPARTKPAPTPRQAQEAKPKAAGSADDRLIRADLSRYHVHDVKTPSGRKAIDRDDAVAQELRGLPLDKVYALASSELGDTVAQLEKRYGHLNPGMQRMNLGNKIRGARAAAARAAAEA